MSGSNFNRLPVIEIKYTVKNEEQYILSPLLVYSMAHFWFTGRSLCRKNKAYCSGC